MNALWQTPAVIFVLLSWLNAPPAGLADIAAREALRREATPKSRATLTNFGLPPEEVPVSAVTMPPPPDAPPTDPKSAATPADKDQEKDKKAPPRDQQWWRTTMADARTAVDRGQIAVDALQARVNALQADAVNIDDPIRQARARMDLQTTLGELDRVKKQLDTDRKAIAALQDEARRLNVPAGWIR